MRSTSPNRFVLLAAALGLILLLPTPSEAQERSQNPLVRDVAAGAALGSRLRVTLPGRIRTHGELVEVGDTHFTIRPEGGPVLRLGGADRVLVERRANHAAQGALTGGLFFGTFGSFGGVAAAALSNRNRWLGAFMGVAIVGGVGAGLGALIGASLPRWVRIAPMEGSF